MRTKPYEWQQVTEYTTTLFGRVAMFADKEGTKCIFRKSTGAQIGPLCPTREQADAYAKAKGWALHPLE